MSFICTRKYRSRALFFPGQPFAFERVVAAGITVLFSLIFLLTGCSGAEGHEKEKEIQGEHGRVNVQTLTFHLNKTDWQNQGTQEITSWATSEITKKIVSSGTVLVYVNEGTNVDQWTALPFTRQVDSFNVTLSYMYQEGTFNLLITKNTETSVAQTFARHQVRVVVIPQEGELYLGSFDATDYETLARFFDL